MPVDEFGREIPHHGSKQREPSPPPRDNKPLHTPRSRRNNDDSPPRRRPRPIQRYVQEPMLCEFIWKDTVAAEKKESSSEQDQPDANEDSKNGEEKETYDEYRRAYCLNYVRAFFNEHMDDSWFRNRYSPLARRRIMEQHLERATEEARAIQQDLKASQEKFLNGVHLGGGTKERSFGGGSSGIKRKHDAAERSLNPLPVSHVHSISDRTVRLLDVPPHVTEEQLQLALLDHASSRIQVKVFSGPVNAKDTENPLSREAFCIFDSPEIKKEVLGNIQKASVETSEGHVPRKDINQRVLMELDVECSDPYGRLELEDEAGGTVPPRKAIVGLTSDFHNKVVVLSAAVSSKKRITQDKESAILMAEALDVKNKIAGDCRLNVLLEPLQGTCSDEDILDVSIAYLRRVHLFSFYNGCTYTDNLAQVLSGAHPTGTIHLRLKNADEILQKAKDDTPAAIAEEEEKEESPKKVKDLLVMRLDESIRKATVSSKEWLEHEGLICPRIDNESTELEDMEKRAELDWIEQHGIIDGADGRARCGFHFCRKLFKDMNFLEKHLKKKHSEFCRAEVAKCHDSFMMGAWDSEEVRPVPAILVDCGSEFGLVPSPVIGAATPMSADPEPELWKKEEDRRQRLAEQEAQRQRERHRQEHMSSGDGDGGGPPMPPPRRANFVDVDDMPEEKVELSFENVDVPVEPPKKKKKKKKLL